MLHCHRCGSKLEADEPNEYALASMRLLCQYCNRTGHMLTEFDKLTGIDNFDIIWGRYEEWITKWKGKFRKKHDVQPRKKMQAVSEGTKQEPGQLRETEPPLPPIKVRFLPP